jgi:predicted nucleic acid-binding protein
MVNYLIDTNVISELRKDNCNPQVKFYLEKISSKSVFISVISIGEIAYGIKKLHDEKKKAELSIWFDNQLPEMFSGRIIPIDMEVMIEWGNIRAKYEKTLPFLDSLIAATALTHHLTLLTRNIRDFECMEDISLLNPWNA